jgi:hypothetical protein
MHHNDLQPAPQRTGTDGALSRIPNISKRSADQEFAADAGWIVA